MLLRRLVPAAALLACAALVTPTAHAAGPAHSSIGSQWADPGPFEVIKESTSAHTLYRPAVLGDGGHRHAVIIWGNGTGATPEAYDDLLRHWASHGFIVAAANTKNANSGQEMLDGARFLLQENDRPGSPYHQKVDADRIGSVGHSQGGAGAINAGADPIVDTTIPLEPGPLAEPEQLHGPALFLAGQNDGIVDPQRIVLPLYERAAHVPAFYAELAGADHFEPVADGGGFRGVMTAWFRYQLAGDEQAAAEFTGPSCGLCTDPAWSDVRSNGTNDGGTR
ncbi:acetylxylan esterase [Saccharopolyspora taberi]